MMHNFLNERGRKGELSNLGFKGIFVLLCAIGLAFWFIPSPGDESTEEVSAPAPHQDAPGEVVMEVQLWLPNQYATRLASVEKKITSAPSLPLRIKATLDALLQDETFTLLPKETFIRELFVHDKEAIISLDSVFRKKFVGGALDELLAVTALVNTVISSFPETIESVTILVDDRPSEIFAAHVDISRTQQSDFSFNLLPEER